MVKKRRHKIENFGRKRSKNQIFQKLKQKNPNKLNR